MSGRVTRSGACLVLTASCLDNYMYAGRQSVLCPQCPALVWQETGTSAVQERCHHLISFIGAMLNSNAKTCSMVVKHADGQRSAVNHVSCSTRAPLTERDAQTTPARQFHKPHTRVCPLLPITRHTHATPPHRHHRAPPACLSQGVAPDGEGLRLQPRKLPPCAGLPPPCLHDRTQCPRTLRQGGPPR